MKWEKVVYSITMFTIILSLSPYLNRIPMWVTIFFMAVLIISMDLILSKIKISVSKKVDWPIIITALIFVGVLNNLLY